MISSRQLVKDLTLCRRVLSVGLACLIDQLLIIVFLAFCLPSWTGGDSSLVLVVDELIRPELHAVLKAAFSVPVIHSEYGMTELLSQAYSKGEGIYQSPPWMKILLRDDEDPLRVITSGSGVVNVIDLANIHSCSFIATDDAGKVYPDGSFEILGRVDESDMRGCSLLVV